MQNFDYENYDNYFLDEEPNKVKSSIYKEPKRKISKSNNVIQSNSKILLQSVLWFGIGFIGVACLGLLWTWILLKFFSTNGIINDSAMTTLFILLGVTLIVSLIFSIFTPFRRTDRSLGFTIFTYIFYILMYSLLFAVISSLLTYVPNFEWYIILVGFATTGLLTLLCGLIAGLLTIRSALTIGKMITILFMVMLFGSLLVSFLMFWSIEAVQWWYMIYDVLLCLVMILFMIMTFFQIRNVSESLVGQQLSRATIVKLGMHYGTQILSSFMIIFMLIIQFIARRKN